MAVCKRNGIKLNDAIKLTVTFLVAGMLSACGDDGGNASDASDQEDGGREVETVKNLGSCTEEREGDTVYVAEKMRDYLCKNNSWVDLGEGVAESSSSKNEENNSANSNNGKKSESSSSCLSESASETPKSLTDSRNGQIYRVVKIGNQIWMAENLNYKTANSHCYDDDESNCDKYGRLYTWDDAMAACPVGWHLPTYDEWDTLLNVVGDKNSAGTALKSSSGWFSRDDYDANGTDTYSFSVLPAGSRSSEGSFWGGGQQTWFWSASEIYNDGSYSVYGVAWTTWAAVFYDADGNLSGGTYASFLGLDALGYKDDGISVRCIKGPAKIFPSKVVSGATQGTVTDNRDGKTYRTTTIGTQTWMAENLNYMVDNSWCLGNDASYCAIYGRLYTWEAAHAACPQGWHLPSVDDWLILFKAVGVQYTGGTVLKAKKGWKPAEGGEDGDRESGGTDAYGFSALPAGICRKGCTSSDEDDFGAQYTWFWSASRDVGVEMSYEREDVEISEGVDGDLSVRCLQD